MNVRDQRRQLLDAREVTCEQDDAADERRLEPLALIGLEARAAQIDHQRT